MKYKSFYFIFVFCFIISILITTKHKVIAQAISNFSWNLIEQKYYNIPEELASSSPVQVKRTGTCVDICKDLGMNASAECEGWTSDSCRKTISSSGDLASASTDCLETDLISRGVYGANGYEYCCCGETYDETLYDFICSDTDYGKDYLNKGTVTHSLSGIRTDRCSGSRLQEFWCEDNVIQSEYYQCESGCSDGKCIEDELIDRSDEIINLRAYNIKSDSATIAWETNEGYACTIEYKINYLDEFKSTLGQIVQNGTAHNYYQYIYNKKITDLSPGTIYDYKVICVDENNDIISEKLQLTTEKDKNAITTESDQMIISNENAIWYDYKTIIFTWSTNQPASYNKLIYKDITTGIEKNKQTEDNLPTTSHEIIMDDLDSTHAYQYQFHSSLTEESEISDLSKKLIIQALGEESNTIYHSPEHTINTTLSKEDIASSTKKQEQLQKQNINKNFTENASSSINTYKIKQNNLYQKLKGKIMLKVEDNGEAFYIHPENKTMYFLGRPNDAFKVMKEQGIGITNKDLENIPVGLTNLTGEDSDKDGLPDDFEIAIGTNPKKQDSDDDSFNDLAELTNGYSPVLQSTKLSFNTNFIEKNIGKIFLQIENQGEAWYINPDDKKRYFLGRPDDAYSVMRQLSLGISNKDFDSISNVNDDEEE